MLFKAANTAYTTDAGNNDMNIVHLNMDGELKLIVVVVRKSWPLKNKF